MQRAGPRRCDGRSPAPDSVILSRHADAARVLCGRQRVVEEVQHDLFVAVGIQVERELLRILVLRVGRTNAHLFRPVGCGVQVNGDLFARRLVAKVQNDFRTTRVCAGSGTTGHINR